MIYTVGHRENYLAAMEKRSPDPLFKKGKAGEPDDPDYYAGGIAFETVEAANAYLEQSNHIEDWAVFGLACTWNNTYPDPRGRYGYLIVEDTPIVGLIE